MAKDDQSFETKLIHAGEPNPRINGAINVPIFQSSTYEYTCLLYTSDAADE